MACGYEALKRADIPVTKYYASEIDKYAIQVAKKNHPDIIHLGDVQGWQEWGIETPGLIMGGSPCQGFSFAGKQLAFDDPRSKLFFTMVDVINHYQPRYKLLENVKMKTEHLQVITDYMGCDPHFINSALVSAQNRQRYYWYNWNAPDPEDKGILWSDVQVHNHENVLIYSNKAFEWIEKSEKRKNKYFEYTKDSNVKMQMIEASHYKGYSNQRCFGIKDKQIIRYIHVVECERLQTLPDNYTQGVSRTQRYKMLGNGWTVDVIAHLFKHMLQGTPK